MSRRIERRANCTIIIAEFTTSRPTLSSQGFLKIQKYEAMK
jgi:hypothetical protein